MKNLQINEKQKIFFYNSSGVGVDFGNHRRTVNAENDVGSNDYGAACRSLGWQRNQLRRKVLSPLRLAHRRCGILLKQVVYCFVFFSFRQV